MRRFVTNDPAKVSAHTGFDSWYHSLPPKLGIDQFRTALPLVVTGDGETPTVISKEIDRTNLQAITDPGVRLAFHSPYFSFDSYEHASDAYPTLADAVAGTAGTDAELDADLAAGLVADLAETLGLAAPAVPFHAPMNHYRVPRATVSAEAERGRGTAARAAEPYLAGLPAAAALREWLARPTGDVLAGLDALMDAAGIGAVLASSPLNVQELTGIPACVLGDGVWALYQREAPEVHVLARRELPWTALPEPAPCDATTVRALAGARLGYEELDLTHRAYTGFGLDSYDTAPSSRVLRRWREQRTYQDAAYYLLGAQITRAGIDAAMRLTQDGMTSGEHATELDAYQQYRTTVADHVAKLPIRVRTYFTHTHAGDRSHIPARATTHPISPKTSLKIDAGLEIYDERGYLRAVSDITRSAVGTTEATDFYQLLDHTLLHDVLPACRAGQTGGAVFATGMASLDRHRGWLVDAGFCPPIDRPLIDTFGRDIGHLLGKQEPATVVFERNDTAALEAGMVAAAEIQWPYHDYCIGTEDVFLITDNEPINLTRTG